MIKLLLKARKWNILNFADVPSRKSGLKDWNKIIIDEFSFRTLKDNSNTAYSFWKEDKNKMERLGNVFAIRQPLSDGKNFINYLISYVDLYKQLFVFDKKNEMDLYFKLNKKILDIIDGTIDLKIMYQLALLCYGSRFDLDNLTEASLWIFRYVYSLRVSVPNRVQEVTVIKHNKDNKLVERILTLHSENEILSWLKEYKYEPNNENLQGVKGRFIERTKSFFNIPIEEDNISAWDSQLKQKILDTVNTK